MSVDADGYAAILVMMQCIVLVVILAIPMASGVSLGDQGTQWVC